MYICCGKVKILRHEYGIDCARATAGDSVSQMDVELEEPPRIIHPDSPPDGLTKPATTFHVG